MTFNLGQKFLLFLGFQIKTQKVAHVLNPSRSKRFKCEMPVRTLNMIHNRTLKHINWHRVQVPIGNSKPTSLTQAPSTVKSTASNRISVRYYPFSKLNGDPGTRAPFQLADFPFMDRSAKKSKVLTTTFSWQKCILLN